MELPQLKLLAGRVRALLQQSNHNISHNQSLDVIATLPGLRNWPEVMAFPDRVAACELDIASASRLSFRLKRQFQFEMSAPDLLTSVNPENVEVASSVVKVWPTGPAPGIYITTEKESIAALLDQYTNETDGAVIYAERAANGADNTIDLGEYGLWSSGLMRVDSGTLIVVGPLHLNQQEWDDCTSRIQQSASLALEGHHRIAVLFETPTPDGLSADVKLMLRLGEFSDDEIDQVLQGDVTTAGTLESRHPFSHPTPAPTSIKTTEKIDAIPVVARPFLREILAVRSTGLLLFGSSIIEENSASRYVAAALSLTDHAGPAARILPRNRSTPSKWQDVPESIRQLPFLPSIESAYDQGYRRMIIDPHYLEGELLLEFSNEVLFIGGTFSSDSESLLLRSLRTKGRTEEGELLKCVIAALGIKIIPHKNSEVEVCDLYIGSDTHAISSIASHSDAFDFVLKNRKLAWEDVLNDLLDTGKLTIQAVKAALDRERGLVDFLKLRNEKQNQRLSVE